MRIENKINESIKDSMKNKDKIRLDSLRAIKSSILLEKTKSKSKAEIDEKIVIKILQKLVKQRNESAKIYYTQNRPELADVEILQAKIISEFLPDQLSEPELSKIIDEVIKKTQSKSMKDMGRVINEVNNEVSGRAEGSLIAKIIKDRLST
tara:strand:- start:6165 stop:6617 length:453 start_codon:yes stop_codon:yes gene_type:complete